MSIRVRGGDVAAGLQRVGLGDPAVLLGLRDLADPVQLQRPLQVAQGEVGLADRRAQTVRVADLAVQFVGRAVVGSGQLVQPQLVIADCDPDVRAAAHQQVLDAPVQHGLGGGQVTQHRVDVVLGQVTVAEHEAPSCPKREGVRTPARIALPLGGRQHQAARRQRRAMVVCRVERDRPDEMQASRTRLDAAAQLDHARLGRPARLIRGTFLSGRDQAHHLGGIHRLAIGRPAAARERLTPQDT